MTTIAINLTAPCCTGIREIAPRTSIRELFLSCYPHGNTSDFVFKKNGYEVRADSILEHADQVDFVARFALPAGYGQSYRAPQTGYATPTGNGDIRVTYINNDGTGFADVLALPAGITIGQLFSRQLPNRRPADYLIRVNGEPALASQVLNTGDKVTMTPKKIDGAAEQIRVTYINNDGAGFADTIAILAGTTVGQLFGQRSGGGNPANFLIRVNSQPATAGQVLNNGDKVSFTPKKIDGAIA
jgi:hypothetical protein